MSLARWRNRRGYGHPLDLEGEGGVPRSYHGDVLCDPFSQSVRHSGGALQRILDEGIGCMLVPHLEKPEVLKGSRVFATCVVRRLVP